MASSRKKPRAHVPLDQAAFDPVAYLREINAADSLRIVVSGHLYIQQALAGLIRTRLPHPDALDLEDLRFPQLLDLAIAVDVVHLAERPAYLQINKLRNKLAHGLGAVVTNGDVDDLINSMNPLQRHMAEEVLSRRLLPGRDLQPILVTLFENLRVRLGIFAEQKSSPLPWLTNYEKDLTEAIKAGSLAPN